MSNSSKPFGIVYVIAHDCLGAVKVGCSSAGTDRIGTFARDGWQPFRRLRTATPDHARTVEQATLFHLRHRLYIQPFLTARHMPAGGWTETSSINLISPGCLWDLVCEQAGLFQMSPVVLKAPDGRRRNGGTPPRRRPGDTARYHAAARLAASETARQHAAREDS